MLWNPRGHLYIKAIFTKSSVLFPFGLEIGIVQSSQEVGSQKAKLVMATWKESMCRWRVKYHPVKCRLRVILGTKLCKLSWEKLENIHESGYKKFLTHSKHSELVGNLSLGWPEFTGRFCFYKPRDLEFTEEPHLLGFCSYCILKTTLATLM